MNDWVELNLPFGPAYDEHLEYEDSLDKRGLAKPGVLVECENGEQYLIGHINRHRGICDDCEAFGPYTIIKKYKVVWKE